jgi:hypothetical protein
MDHMEEVTAGYKLVAEFFNHSLFAIFGGIGSILIVFGFTYKVISIFFGVMPLAIRLGYGLWKRKIAVISDADSFAKLSHALKSSKLFSEKNISHVPLNTLESLSVANLYLVDWDTAGGSIEEIFQRRANSQIPIVIVARPASIPHETMNSIANRPNTVVVNFLGRLLNDVLTSLMTTSYDAK